MPALGGPASTVCHSSSVNAAFPVIERRTLHAARSRLRGASGSRLCGEMVCPSCGTENLEGKKFCKECGTALATATNCGSCGAALAGDEKFCDECGATVAAENAAPRPGHLRARGSRGRAPARLRALRRPRRLHAASRSRATRGDSRAALALLRHLPAADRAVRRHGGEVHRRRGDGRVGHADRDRGRCRAGGSRRARPRRGRLGARARRSAPRSFAPAPGVLTGEAAVTIGAEGEGMVAGDLVNTASRVQSVAEPGSVFVGESTRRATEQTVVYEEAGAFELKGKEGLTPLWQARRVVSGVRGTLKSHGPRGAVRRAATGSCGRSRSSSTSARRSRRRSSSR